MSADRAPHGSARHALGESRRRAQGALRFGGASLVAVALLSTTARADTLIPAETPPQLACGSAAADWNQLRTDETAFHPRTLVPDLGAGCPRTQLLRWRFTVGTAQPRVLVTLRARYQHGFVAYLDGVEVARRRLPPDATLDTLASDLHGPEWEHIPLAARGIGAGEHVLAVEAHPRTAGREPSFDVELIAAAGPSFSIAPYLVDVDTDGALVAFETDAPTVATLRWGTRADELDHAAAEHGGGGPARHHLFRMEGLHAATTYYYAVSASAPDLPSTTIDSEALDFHTLPGRGRPLRFVIYGDVRSGHDVHADLVRTLRGEGADLAIMTGDLVDMGSDDADWTRYFSIATPLLARLPVFPAPGNHEYARGGRGAARFRQLFRPLVEGPLWHSFDVAGVHFIALDSTSYRSLDQITWLKRDLEKARKARAIFAYAHEGAYSSGLHGDSDIAKAQYAPLLEKAGATLYISGHDHHYERGRVGKLDYVVSGGGGAELRTWRCGVPGRKPCPPRMLAYANEHHYIVIDVLPGLMRMCPKRPDGTAIEPCVTRALGAR